MPNSQDILRQIRDAARAVVQQSIHIQTTQASPINPFIKRSIKPAESIAPRLVAHDLSPAVVEEISLAFLKASTELHKSCETSLQRAMQDLSSHGLLMDSKVQEIFQVWNDMYMQQIQAWAEKAIMFAKKQYSQCTGPSNKKSHFNHEYTPLLEKYFEYNAYPSAPDRLVLARKSMMTPRQIEVWFQNHRNRARKDGKILRRLSSDSLPLNLSLDSLESSMPFFTISERERKPSARLEVSDSEESRGEDDSAIRALPPLNPHAEHLFDAPAPPHAFPTRYPPLCRVDPFPRKTGNKTFPAPIWRRTCATTRPSCANITIEDLIGDFASKLGFGECSSERRRQTSPALGASTRRPWFAATHTTPPSAPHPALLRTLSGVAPTSLSTPAIAAYPSCLHLFQSMKPCTPLVTSSGITPRKVARLPRRTPNHKSIAHYRTSPAIPKVPSSPPSLTSPLRASSISSDESSLRHPSSSSSSSAASSTLTTPVFSSTSLPDCAPSPISISGIDFQDMDDLLGNFPNNMSPLGGSTSKYPSHPGFDFPTTIPTKDPFNLDLNFAIPLN